MRKNIFFIASAIVFLAACNNNDEALTSQNDITPQIPNEFAISNDEAKEVLNFFVNDGATTRNDGKTITIKDYKVRNVEVKTDDNTEIVPVYEYTTENENGEEGYSIVIGDRRIQKVLVQVDKGSLADTINIPPLKWFINSIPNIVTSDLHKYKIECSDKYVKMRDSYVETQYCFLPTTWGQNAPYNSQCPAYGIDLHYPTGCTPLAVGQIFAYHRVPANLDWDSILQYPQITSSSSTSVKYQVASLLATLGVELHAKYPQGGAVFCNDSIPIVIRSHSMYCDNRYPYNLEEVVLSLSHNRPVILQGFEATTYDPVTGESVMLGHTWVCDGWKRHHYDNNVYYDYLDMNWGWNGNSNGFYYISSPMSFYVNGHSFMQNFKMVANIRKS